MNIIEFLGLPAEHAEEFIELAAEFYKAQQRSFLDKNNIKAPVSNLAGEDLIKAVLKQQIVTAVTKTAQARSQKAAADQAANEIKEKLKG